LYQVEDLGTFGTFNDTSSVVPSDINDDGTVVGGLFYPNGVLAFSFTSAAGIVNLGGAPNAGANSIATGINAAGQMAFMADRSGGGGAYAPARYSAPPPNVSQLPYLSTAGYTAVPPASYYTGGINGCGQIVGLAGASDTQQLPFFNDGLTTVSLGSLGGTWGGAGAINDRGDIVGYSATATTPPGNQWNLGHAFLYTNAAKMQDLNALAKNPSWELLMASDINAYGEIVGYGTFTSSQGQALSAFLYKNGVVRNLGTFPNGGISWARGINNRGDIVGEAYLNASGVGNYEACIFVERFGAVNLNSLIDPSLGWNLRVAVAINDAGQITGYGTRSGAVGGRGFLLTPAW
jgi:probable HAF family extracellular repeat protein